MKWFFQSYLSLILTACSQATRRSTCQLSILPQSNSDLPGAPGRGAAAGLSILPQSNSDMICSEILAFLPASFNPTLV